jgi:hypothetical protein
MKSPNSGKYRITHFRTSLRQVGQLKPAGRISDAGTSAKGPKWILSGWLCCSFASAEPVEFGNGWKEQIELPGVLAAYDSVNGPPALALSPETGVARFLEQLTVAAGRRIWYFPRAIILLFGTGAGQGAVSVWR